MPKRYTYVGHIEIEYQALISLMKSVLNSSKVKDRYASDIERVIQYNDDKLEIYVYEDGRNGFLWQGEYIGLYEEAQDFINTLTEKLREKNIQHQFEWSEVDENDKQIGEEYEIKFMNE